MKQKLILNTITSLLLQLVTVICGFILPRLILTYYGSEVNGLVQSITQFIGVITLMELGVGQVIQSTLYKPLAEKKFNAVSEIVVSGNSFFKKIAYLLIIYVILLMAIYPVLTHSNFSWIFSATLIFTISISSFAQYYFGIIDKILLNADQRGYIQFVSQILALLLSTAVSILLIKHNYSIQSVKLAASLIYVIRPWLLRLYIKKHYSINRKIKYEDEPIKQKWNGIAQHIAGFVLAGTDTIVLTIFSTLVNVSIYSIYSMITTGIQQLYRSATAGIHSLVGNLWAKQELEKLSRTFGYIEIVLHMSIVFLFTSVGILIVPFVSVYTKGVTDANYIQINFAIILVLAHAFEGLKTTYNILILAGGHYKQTQRCHITAASLNLVVSIIMVNVYGLIGVAIGTLIAMVYQTIWMAIYDSKNLIKWPIKNFMKQIAVDIITVLVICVATMWIELQDLTYVAWFIMAIEVATIAAIVVLLMSFIFYRDKCKALMGLIMRRK